MTTSFEAFSLREPVSTHGSSPMACFAQTHSGHADHPPEAEITASRCLSAREIGRISLCTRDNSTVRQSGDIDRDSGNSFKPIAADSGYLTGTAEFSAAPRARVVLEDRSLSKQRAQGKPGAHCTRGRVCSVESTRASHHRYAGNARPSLRNACSPASKTHSISGCAPECTTPPKRSMFARRRWFSHRGP